jgi:hypothetical protein
MNAVQKGVIRLVTAYHKWTLKQELKSAINIAKEQRYKTHKKHMVLYLDGKFQAYERSRLKELIFKGGTFKRGVNIKQLEKMAYYITD